MLDEAAAFTDLENKHKIQRVLEFLTENKPIVMIAHRLSTIKNVDQIIVLKYGKILEQGSSKSLMEIKDMYYKMVEL
ncbi:hypothetical protein LIY46_09240 [Fusobacterium varium]|uniref:hypothetical protein n=1 Tax=Fusobacterium TaxID=848 RepID=UPI0015A0A75C